MMTEPAYNPALPAFVTKKKKKKRMRIKYFADAKYYINAEQYSLV